MYVQYIGMNTGKLWGETSGISVQQIMLKLKGIHFMILHTHTVQCTYINVYCIVYKNV